MNITARYVDHRPKPDYPYFGVNKTDGTTLVLFSGSCTGCVIVIGSGHPYNRYVGESLSSWDEDDFVPWYGTIEVRP